MGKRKFRPSYNVFVDNGPGMQLLALNFDSAYDASAVAHVLSEETGYCVYSDLHSAIVPDAMLRPEVVEKVRQDFAGLGVKL